MRKKPEKIELNENSLNLLNSLNENFLADLNFKRNLNDIIEESSFVKNDSYYQPSSLVALGTLGAGIAGYALGHDYADAQNEQLLNTITQGKEHIDPKIVDEIRDDDGIFFDKNAEKLERLEKEYPLFKHDIKPYDTNNNGLLDEDEIKKIKRSIIN